MSVPVDLSELEARLAEYGPVAFVVTVGADGRPHVVSTRVELTGGTLVGGAGRTTSANVAGNDAVTMLWPSPDGGAYCLIVDGAGTVTGEDADAKVVVDPSRAVLHRMAGAADDAGPSCITVL
jgi:hypothetical protein